jgi:ATP-binding cassette subfamily F protein 3
VRVREERREAGGSPTSAAPAAVGEAASNGDGVATPRAVARGRAGASSKSDGKDVSKNRLREQQKAERAIEDAEAALKVLEEELAAPEAWATKYEAAKSEARHTAAKRAVEQAYARLETLISKR